MADTRGCQQCGEVFAPRREHARFCSVRCRVAWNREHLGDPAVDVSALQWSITGMSETVDRLARASFPDPRQALSLIGEAVWWVTIVDATLVRHHVQTYDAVMTGQCPEERRVTEETLAGLRFVRNQLGHKVEPAELAAPGPGSQCVRDWTWKPVPDPTLPSFPMRAHTWETARHQAYQAQLAGRSIGETFGRAVTFLQLASADTAPASDPDLESTR